MKANENVQTSETLQIIGERVFFSRSVVFMEWDKIWAINKKTIDPVAPRFTAVDGSYSVPVKVAGSDVKVEAATVNKHPKDEAIGTKTVWRSATGKFALLVRN